MRVLAELGHSQIQNKPLLNGTIPGQIDLTRLRPQRRTRRGNPDAGALPDTIGYSRLYRPQRSPNAGAVSVLKSAQWSVLIRV
jgi:hypothetical protein